MKVENKSQWLAAIYVGIQLTILAFFTFSSQWITRSNILNIFILLGILIGLWAIYAVGPSRANIRPLPHPKGALITNGPYKFIRHPMYTAQLLVTAVWVINNNSIPYVVLWIVYLSILAMKLNFEEKQLLVQFPEYGKYKQHTWRLLPLIWYHFGHGFDDIFVFKNNSINNFSNRLYIIYQTNPLSRRKYILK